MNHTSIIVGAAIVGAVASALGLLGMFAYSRWRSLKILEGSKWGINLSSDLKCPKCGTPVPAIRIPKNFRQFMWGGSTCANCGEEFDKWLRPVSKDREHT